MLQPDVMAVELNHTVVATHDRQAGSRFLADVLGLPEPGSFGPFAVVQTANGVSLDFMDSTEVVPQHYAFLISEDEFDAVAVRLRERGIATYADPGHRQPGHNTNDGGRGLYFDSPEGHNLEVLTRPYGSGPA
jgi:extradiol dioxygenase family protein